MRGFISLSGALSCAGLWCSFPISLYASLPRVLSASSLYAKIEVFTGGGRPPQGEVPNIFRGGSENVITLIIRDHIE